MRIIAGAYRGRVLKTISGSAVRPTGARLRESLFDVLGDSVQGEVFVDFYAGSGAVGLEALSRGAARVYLIEENESAQALTGQNLQALGPPPNATLLRSSARRALRRLEQEGVRARFCFLDPPYDSRRERDQTLRWIAESSLMEPHGSIIVQHDKKDVPPESLGEWRRTRILAQGSNAVSFYRRKAMQ
jgi:16S rRNA (guanine(966)-N(2))-methyltransferase RsmD